MPLSVSVLGGFRKTVDFRFSSALKLVWLFSQPKTMKCSLEILAENIVLCTTVLEALKDWDPFRQNITFRIAFM